MYGHHATSATNCRTSFADPHDAKSKASERAPVQSARYAPGPQAHGGAPPAKTPSPRSATASRGLANATPRSHAPTRTRPPSFSAVRANPFWTILADFMGGNAKSRVPAARRLRPWRACTHTRGGTHGVALHIAGGRPGGLNFDDLAGGWVARWGRRRNAVGRGGGRRPRRGGLSRASCGEHGASVDGAWKAGGRRGAGRARGRRCALREHRGSPAVRAQASSAGRFLSYAGAVSTYSKRARPSGALREPCW